MKLAKIIFFVILVLSITIVLSACVYEDYNAKNHEAEVIDILESVIPEEFLGSVETNENPSYEIDSFSYVGMLRIPKLDAKYPVLKEESKEKKFTFSMYTVDNIDNQIILVANDDYGRLEGLKMLKEYDTIYFKNMRGLENQYTITSITNANEEINNFEENIVIKIKKYKSYLTIKGVIKQ